MPAFDSEGGRPGGVHRREVLKAAAAALVAGATSAWAGFAHVPVGNDHSSVANTRGTAMNSQPLMTVRIAAAPAQRLGAVPHGMRSIVLVTGGDFEGPRLRGKVLPGGGDWLLLRAAGVLGLDLRITPDTDAHALICMTFQGVGHGPPGLVAALRTVW